MRLNTILIFNTNGNVVKDKCVGVSSLSKRLSRAFMKEITRNVFLAFELIYFSQI